MNTITNSHANDTVLFERHVPVADLGSNFHGQKPGVPVLGSAALVEAFNKAGEPISVGTPDLTIPDQAVPNDIIGSDHDGNLYVYRGSYWIDAVETNPETGEEIALLHLGSQVRCTEYDWCVGHRWVAQDTIDPELKNEHYSAPSEVWAYGNITMTVSQVIEPGSTQIQHILYVDTDDLREAGVSLLDYATEFEKAAERLRKLAASE